MAKNAARLVGDAILGNDIRVVAVAGKTYVIEPPTIYRLAGAASNLAPVAEAQTMADVLTNQGTIRGLAAALSHFITGDGTLTSELSNGTLTDIVGALRAAYDLISVKDFLTLLTLARNVARTTANQKQ